MEPNSQSRFTAHLTPQHPVGWYETFLENLTILVIFQMVHRIYNLIKSMKANKVTETYLSIACGEEIWFSRTNRLFISF